MTHPAPYSDEILPVLAAQLEGYNRILDPMAGTGKLRQVRPDAYLIEIEPEWAEEAGAQQGNALALPFPDRFFDCVVTSCTYGNRVNDHYRIGDTSRRNTYQAAIGHDLHPDNTGRFKFGMKKRKYEELHRGIWAEVYRVLSLRGRFILNVSDSLRTPKKGAPRIRLPVADFHRQVVTGLGFSLLDQIDVVTPRNRYGANGDVRVECEHVLIFEKRA